MAQSRRDANQRGTGNNIMRWFEEVEGQDFDRGTQQGMPIHANRIGKFTLLPAQLHLVQEGVVEATHRPNGTVTYAKVGERHQC